MSQFIFPPLSASLDSEQINGGTLPAKQMIIGGYDGANVRAIKTDAAGELQVDISSSALPSGAATSALQTAGNNILTTIDADTSLLAGAVSGTELQVDVVASLPAGTNAIGKLSANSGVDIGDVDVLSSALPTGAATSALQTTANGILTTIDADTSILAGAVSGTEVQVDVLTSALPSGAATSALQTTANGILTTIDADTGSLAGCVAGTEVQVDIVTMPSVTVNSIAPVDFLDSGVIDTSTANIATGGTTVVSSLAADCTQIEIQEDIGEYMSLRVGGVVKSYLPLGGGKVKVNLSTGNTVQLYSEIGTAIASGKIAINFLG